MNRTLKAWFITWLLLQSSQTHAAETVSLSNAYADALFYRPAGLMLTITGSAILVALSPFLAIGNLSSDQDTWSNATDILVVTPYRFTFERPLGIINCRCEDH